MQVKGFDGCKKVAFVATAFLVLLLAISLAGGFQIRKEPSRFDPVVIYDPSNISPSVIPAESLREGDALRAGWDSFKALHGSGWKIFIDSRSGAPLLVEGQGIPWIPGSGNRLTSPEAVTIDHLERTIRQFMADNVRIFLAGDSELALNRDASMQVTPEIWQIIFDRAVNGIPVVGDQFIFHIGHGNLISFGATRWGKITTSPVPSIPSSMALQDLKKYMGINESDSVELIESGKLFYLPLASSGLPNVLFTGNVGEGFNSALVWKFVMRIFGEPGTWVGMVDAHNGQILALFDDDKYAQVKGGVYPESDDQICPSGCEQANFPAPFADITIGASSQTAGSTGMFECSPDGSVARTTLNGPYVQVYDNCGSISESVTCDDDLNLRTSTGIDCAVPSGSSAGNTHAARSSFYHINRAKETARFWLPDNSWLKSKLTDNVNINSTCNAYWSGSVNFYKSGGGCNNTGEIAGVVLHEWGHGFDQNDGGGYDNPSEAYADTSEFMYDHTSCIGRGFYQSGMCSGYGNPCLDCTGIRDQDWDKRADHQPSTPANWPDNCPGGSAPCGKEEHCEGYIAAETIWDLAARDLPAAGYDQATAWHITDRDWFKSRGGSTGNAYNCSPPNSDGCGAYTWYSKLRTIDDDDGNLNNGTPHAAAIFNAFNRHNIACGSASDSSNKNYSACPSLGSTTLSGTAGSGSASLSWTPVTNAATYYVLRNDIGCSRSFGVIATVNAPATTFTDPNLANEFPVYYRVVPYGSNSSCLGPASNCVDVTPQPYAGSIKLDRALYNCNDTIKISVKDANIGSPTTTAKIWSTTEPTPETVTLTETPAGSLKYIGTINTTPNPPAADGLLSLTNGEIITAEYIDADDGMGGHNLVRQTSASTDCIAPVISNVLSKDITDTQATITWSTNEASDSVLTWGPNKPPANEKSSSSMVTAHSIQLTGLQSCTYYYYQVSSSDSSKNKVTDNKGGQYYNFETYGNFGQGLQPCHQGRVTVFKDIYSCSSDPLSFQVIDMDLNKDPSAIETATLLVTSTTEIIPEYVTATETGPYTSIFVGSILTAKGTPVQDGKLQGNDHDIATVTYLDANDGTGAGRTTFDTAAMDCAGPAINNLQVSAITDQRFSISFTTDEPGNTAVEWGPTPSLGNTMTLTPLTTSHQLLLNKLSMCDPYYIRVSSTDAYGNKAIGDMNGQPHQVYSWDIPGLYWQETFEGDTSGWSLNGEWQIGTPQGKGGKYGNPDPVGAYNNTMALGDDLTGLGANPGDYENSITEEATSPSINASSWVNTKLLMYRQLNVQNRDTAWFRLLQQNNEYELFNSNAQTINQSGFSQLAFDVSSYVDGKNNVKLRFHINSDYATAPYDDGISSGWNIDDIIFKDGTKPDYAACGGCGMTPSFNGAKSATDNNACAATGVTVSWNAALAWGTGSGGSYAVYRDTVPDFTPSSLNRIATGLTGTSYNDGASPTDCTLYYLVRAENDETTCSGPNNGGAVDGNTSYVSVSETTTRQIPNEVMTLRAEMVNDAHLRLSWQAQAGAQTYRIYRASAPNGTFTKIAETSNLFYEDLNQGSNVNNYYYKVTCVNPCNQEGP